jgi:uncharacterized protein
MNGLTDSGFPPKIVASHPILLVHGIDDTENANVSFIARGRRFHRGGKSVKVVMFYEMAPDGFSKVMANLEGHRARLNEFHAKGVLLMAGPFADPAEGALGIFTDKKAAEEFIEGDPFVMNGVVGKWRLSEWNEVLASPQNPAR